MHRTFQCNRCGGHNPSGQAFCSWCGTRFYFNCPNCGAWVNNAYHLCPNCHQDLNWSNPRVETTEKGRSHAVLFSLVATILVFVVAFILIENNSGSGNRPSAALTVSTPAVASPPEATPVRLSPQVPAAYQSAQAQTPYVTPSGQASTLPADASPVTPPAQTPTPYQGSQPQMSNIPPSWQQSINSGATIQEINIPVIPTQTSTTSRTASGPTRSAYLEQLDPGWGHCSGGSCRAAASQ
jgi:hypothetical protein